jgi:Na+/glutamate symporter
MTWFLLSLGFATGSLAGAAVALWLCSKDSLCPRHHSEELKKWMREKEEENRKRHEAAPSSPGDSVDTVPITTPTRKP